MKNSQTNINITILKTKIYMVHHTTLSAKYKAKLEFSITLGAQIKYRFLARSNPFSYHGRGRREIL